MGQASSRIQTRHRIFVVDDHQTFVDGVRHAVEGSIDLEVVGEAADVGTALREFETSMPDLVIVDLSLKDRTGIDLIREMHARFGKIPALVVSAHCEAEYAVRSIKAGALGYVTKVSGRQEMLSAIRAALQGHMYICDSLRERAMYYILRPELFKENPLAALSNQELHVFELIAQECTLEEIAKRTFLSVNTVRTYRDRICKKLGFESVRELEKFAVQWYRENGPF